MTTALAAATLLIPSGASKAQPLGSAPGPLPQNETATQGQPSTTSVTSSTGSVPPSTHSTASAPSTDFSASLTPPTKTQWALRAGAWDRSVALEADGELEAARQLLLDAWGTGSPSYEVTVRIAWLSLQLGDLELAETCYRRAATLPGAGPEASQGLASTLVARGYRSLGEGNRADGRAYFEGAIAIAPERTDAQEGLERARETHVDPELWATFLGYDAGPSDAYGGSLLLHVPLQVTDWLALRAAYRHVEMSESAEAEPTTTAPRPGAGSGGRARARFHQDEIYLGIGAGPSWLWLEVLGVLLFSSTEPVAGGEAARLRIGYRWGAQLEQSLIVRDAGLGAQLTPTAFVWPTDWLGLGAGARITIDEVGTDPSAVLGATIATEPVAVHLSGHVGLERWPVHMAEPTVIALDQALEGGGALSAMFTLDPSWRLGLSGRLERIELGGKGGVYGSGGLGLLWSPR